MSTNKAQKAYRNRDFFDSPAARPLRIMAELIEPKGRLKMHKVEDTIVFFGSARITEDQEGTEKHPLSEYYDSARLLAKKLTTWSMALKKPKKRFIVCSGGGPGIMEAANRGAHDASGMNIGFNISLPFEQNPNPYISDELSFEFHYFFIRKFWFTYLAKAIVVFPGGFGTIDEMVEMLTLIQTEKVKKKVPVVLFGSRFWDDVIDFNKLVEYAVISPKDLDLFHRCDDVDSAFEYITNELKRIHLEG